MSKNAAATQTIRNALIDAGIDLERARAVSAVYYPELLPQVAAVARRPDVIEAIRAFRSEDVESDVDARDVLAMILGVLSLAAASDPIL